MPQRSTFAIVPGSFHRDSCLRPLVEVLQDRGVDSRTAALESAGRADATFTDDIEWIRDTLLQPLLDEGKEVIMVLHSFAGGPGSAAARGFTIPERRSQGLKGGVAGFIFLSAFVLREGVSSEQFLKNLGDPPAWREWDEKAGLFYCKTSRETFYSDVKDETLARELADSVVGHSPLLFEAPTPATAAFDSWFDGRRAYIRTLEDKALPVELQDVLVRDSGLEYIRRDMKCGHSPFVSHPQHLADILVKLEAEFRKV